MKGHPEQIIQLQIIKYLKGYGHVVGKTKVLGVKRGNVYWTDPYLFLGFPDLVAFVNRRLFFIEVKSKTGRQSPYQIRFQQLAEEAGLDYILARSLDDVIERMPT